MIDPHYELKHSDSISDTLILELVKLLDGSDFTPEAVTKGFEYYTTENLVLRGKNTDLFGFLKRISFISVSSMLTGGNHEIPK